MYGEWYGESVEGMADAAAAATTHQPATAAALALAAQTLLADINARTVRRHRTMRCGRFYEATLEY